MQQLGRFDAGPGKHADITAVDAEAIGGQGNILAGQLLQAYKLARRQWMAGGRQQARLDHDLFDHLDIDGLGRNIRQRGVELIRHQLRHQCRTARHCYLELDARIIRMEGLQEAGQEFTCKRF